MNLKPNSLRTGPDERGHFGIYGGRFVAETLMPLILDLERNWNEVKNDPEFKKLVDDEMRRLIQSREINAIYDKWFLKPIPPKNTALNLELSYLLKDFWKYPTDFVPF